MGIDYVLEIGTSDDFLQTLESAYEDKVENATWLELRSSRVISKLDSNLSLVHCWKALFRWYGGLIFIGKLKS